MSSATAISGVALKPIVIPNEHGGWGFLLEPVILGLLVAPSWAGVLIAVAAVFGFLTRQPLKFAMQDAMRGKRYPRTRLCWISAASIAVAATRPWTFVALLVARNVSAIVYVRALFKRAHAAWPIVLHAIAIAVAIPFGWFAIAAMSILFVRAVAGLMRHVPRAQTVGWMEIAFGAVSVVLFAL